MSETSQDIFEVRITVSGKLYIGKFVSLVRMVILGNILVSLSYSAVTAIHTITVDPSIFGNNKGLLLEHNIMPYYRFIHITIAFVEMYYYWKLGQYLKKGIAYNDDILFNKAFTMLYRNAVFAVILILVNLPLAFFDLYLAIERHLN